ncbi:hypothetical protein [Flavobacterium araucananum]|nr:hypothetical protein [Flavobacterium araucananum]
MKVLILLIIILAGSCQSYDKDVSYNELLKLQSTHKITNSNLEKSLHEVLNDTINYSKYDFTILILISNKTHAKNEVCISKTDYNIFKGNRPDGFNKLIGYFNYEGIPVLLFGDNNKAIIRLEKIDFYNILGKMPEYGPDNPPIIFEPRMKCHEEQQ